jgi:hypothetical protein
MPLANYVTAEIGERQRLQHCRHLGGNQQEAPVQAVNYAYLQQLITKRGGYAGLYTSDAKTPKVANPNSHIWASDRTPLDVQLRKLNRQIVLSNPLLNFDDIIFNRWTSRYGHVQECWGSTVLDAGGLYVTSGVLVGPERNASGAAHEGRV